MARFIGTPEDFYDLFGDNLLTNAVQTYTKEYKEMIGRCMDKGTRDIECSDTLQAAHINDASRKSITMDILRPKCDANGEVDIDIEEFLEKFYQAHMPLHKHIRILCSKHHGQYDKGKRTTKFETKDKIYGMPKKKLLANHPVSRNKKVEFSPSIEEILWGLKKMGNVMFISYSQTEPWSPKYGTTQNPR